MLEADGQRPMQSRKLSVAVAISSNDTCCSHHLPLPIDRNGECLLMKNHMPFVAASLCVQIVLHFQLVCFSFLQFCFIIFNLQFFFLFFVRFALVFILLFAIDLELVRETWLPFKWTEANVRLRFDLMQRTLHKLWRLMITILIIFIGCNVKLWVDDELRMMDDGRARCDANVFWLTYQRVIIINLLLWLYAAVRVNR